MSRSSLCEAPNIDRLAREGTDFTRFTVTSGVCSPSRTAVMTGHFPARYNIDGHFAWVPSNAKRHMSMASDLKVGEKFASGPRFAARNAVFTNRKPEGRDFVRWKYQ